MTVIGQLTVGWLAYRSRNRVYGCAFVAIEKTRYTHCDNLVSIDRQGQAMFLVTLSTGSRQVAIVEY